MFKTHVSLALAALGLILFSATSSAAPVSGSLQLDLVITPDCNTLTSFGPSGTSCAKVSGTIVKVEVDLDLTLSVSGLDFTTSTVLTFKGLESEILHAVVTIGALTARMTLAFAASVTEIEIVRSATTLSTRYCIAYQNPGDVTPPFLDCPTADAALFFLIEDAGVFHPIIQNLGLAFTFDSAGALDGPLYFVKKIVELNVNVAGLVIGIRSLFGNLGTAQSPNFATGLVLSFEGQTVSGIAVRAETYFGARQGLECLAECKPSQRLYGGHVVSDFSVQEEKLFIRNLTLAGVTHNVRVEFQFFTQPGDAGPGLTYLEWNQRFRVQPINLIISNTIRLDSALFPRFDLLQINYRAGDVSVTALFYIYTSLTNTWEAQLAEFISSFDPPGVTVTSDLTLCVETLFIAFCQSGVIEHDLYVSAAVGNFTFDAKLIFFSLFSDFQEAWFDVTYRLAPSVELATSYVIGVDVLKALGFSFRWKF